jgi:hypothetical protein
MPPCWCSSPSQLFLINAIMSSYKGAYNDSNVVSFNVQLRIEQRHGHVFVGWNEGKIYFPPTYKYSNNSDQYAGDDMNQKEKRRTPAWYQNQFNPRNKKKHKNFLFLTITNTFNILE